MSNDQHVLTFIKDVKRFKVIDVYVEHNVDIPKIIDDVVKPVNVEKVNASIHDVNDVNVNDDQDNMNVGVNDDQDNMNDMNDE